MDQPPHNHLPLCRHCILCQASHSNWIGLGHLDCTEVCSLECGEALNHSLLWGSTLTAVVFINCSYVRVLLGQYDPEYTSHLNNYGHNKNGTKTMLNYEKYQSFQ